MSMQFTELRQLVRRGEGQYLEFKRKAAHPDKITREVVALANSQGGLLLIGVDDTGEIPGVKFPDEEIYVLQKAMERHSRPVISVQFDTVSVAENRWVVVVEISDSSTKPHYFLEDADPEKPKVYVRVHDRSIQASREVREVLKRYHPQRNVRFQYGDKERILMQFLGEQEFITLTEFAEVAHISSGVASRTLVILVLANVLELIPREGQDLYRMKPIS
jgi:predicted HTH transcriptional regulator